MADVLTHTRLHHFCLNAADPAALGDFYRRAMGMTLSARGDFVRVAAPGRTLLLRQGKANTLGFGAYAVGDKKEWDALVGRVKASGGILASPTPLLADAFAVHDPDGNMLVFGRAEPHDDVSQDAGSLPARLQHLVVATTDVKILLPFYCDTLGFVLSDLVTNDKDDVTAAFLRSDAEHHSFAIFRATRARLDHHSYEAGEWIRIRDWADHFAKSEIKLSWGPGRHGPGNNLFCFVHDPEGNWLEISAELEICKPDRPVGRWPHTERTLNSWGQAFLRS